MGGEVGAEAKAKRNLCKERHANQRCSTARLQFLELLQAMYRALICLQQQKVEKRKPLAAAFCVHQSSVFPLPLHVFDSHSHTTKPSTRQRTKPPSFNSQRLLPRLPPLTYNSHTFYTYRSTAGSKPSIKRRHVAVPRISLAAALLQHS